MREPRLPIRRIDVLPVLLLLTLGVAILIAGAVIVAAVL